MAKPAVLVADDEESVRLLCRVNLEAAGFRLAEAVDGPEAITAATRNGPDLLVLHLMLPGMDGWAVLAALKTAFADNPLRVIIRSATTSEDGPQRALAAGATFLAKPFNPQRLGGPPLSWTRGG